MGLSIDTIITLDNNEKYIVLNETMYNGNKYFLTTHLDKDEIPIKSDVKIFLEIVEGLDTIVEVITDQNLIIELTKKFKEQA